MNEDVKDFARGGALLLSSMLRRNPWEDAAIYSVLGFAVVGFCGTVYHLWLLFA